MTISRQVLVSRHQDDKCWAGMITLSPLWQTCVTCLSCPIIFSCFSTLYLLCTMLLWLSDMLSKTTMYRCASSSSLCVAHLVLSLKTSHE